MSDAHEDYLLNVMETIIEHCDMSDIEDVKQIYRNDDYCVDDCFMPAIIVPRERCKVVCGDWDHAADFHPNENGQSNALEYFGNYYYSYESIEELFSSIEEFEKILKMKLEEWEEYAEE